ncbi:unc-112-related protein-like [Oppia nitens]|uniref:unc-112-related protein-like n=1 Tax=Oppia nitens TaxID=1686743 RepID=UPI0023D9A013|nr:unc-112-related protein-like [Oppia nitens]
MISDGYLVGDGSWQLKIYVTDLKVDRILRVKGDLHIGGVMLKLVEELDVAIDWSDHALWWPSKNIWLSRTRTTLDQYGVQADAVLHFTPMHKTLRVQMPDLRYIDTRVDFSIKTFTAVVQLCKDLGIRHPEELSFSRPLVTAHLKRNFPHMGVSPLQRQRDAMGPIVQTNPTTPVSNIGTPDGKSSPLFIDDKLSPLRNGNGVVTNGNGTIHTPYHSSDSFAYGNETISPALATSPLTPTIEAKSNLLRPKSLVERARLNAGWLDSSLSLYEQDVREFDLLLLRYKFFTFYDINPKIDGNRINQIYSQARWSILTEDIDCTEEEMMLFAALQFQVSLQNNNPFPEKHNTRADDDIDAALDELQISLEGAPTAIPLGSDITHVPELADYLRLMKPKRFTLKSFKRYYVVFRDTRLSVFKSSEDRSSNDPAFVINMKGCEVTPDVNLSQGKYGIKLEVPNHEGMQEYWIRCESEQQYARWMAASRLATKGRTMADSSYDNEVKSILNFLSLQHPAHSAYTTHVSAHQIDNPEDLIAPRFIRKKGGRQWVQRILDAHTNVKGLTLTEAKLHFIKAWQALPDFGISLFVVKFANSKKEELLGVAFNRLMRMDINTGDHTKTWRFNTMKAWNVNWEVKQMLVQFEEEDVVFSCHSADCKVVHEFIGGYIFLSMRSKDQNQTLNEELFHKLTGGWI